MVVYVIIQDGPFFQIGSILLITNVSSDDSSFCFPPMIMVEKEVVIIQWPNTVTGRDGENISQP